MPNSKYVILYDWICERYQGVTREVYALLYGLITNGTTKVSNTYIATRLHVSEKAVKKALRILQADGIIARQSGKHRSDLTTYEKGVQFTPLIPEKGVQNTPHNINNNNINNSLVSLVNPTQPNPVFNDFAQFEQYVNAQTDIPPQIRAKYVDYHRQRTFWRRMTQEEALENLRKWVETEYPARKHKTTISKSYEEYYETFGTTEVLPGWQIIKDENEQIRYVKRN